MAYKIAFIGGGSALWTARLSADMFLEKSLNGSEIVLVDIDNLLLGLFVRKSQQKHIGNGESSQISRLFPPLNIALLSN